MYTYKMLQKKTSSQFASSFSLAAATLLSFAACANVDGLRKQRSDSTLRYMFKIPNLFLH